MKKGKRNKEKEEKNQSIKNIKKVKGKQKRKIHGLKKLTYLHTQKNV